MLEILPLTYTEFVDSSPVDFGFSSCPNDTFAFHALVHGLVPGPKVRPHIDDIEALNLRAASSAAEVTKVKRFESGIVKDPITITPVMTVRDVLQLTRQHKISGLPVVSTNGRVVGIVTNRDLRFETNLDQPVKNIMTPRERLVTVKEGPKGVNRDEAKALMHKHRLERVLVVGKNFELRGLVTVKDILKSSEHPDACKDALGRLRVGAAVGVGEGTEDRVEALIDAGVDVIVVDTAHGHSAGVLRRVKWIKKNYPRTQVIGGNIAASRFAFVSVSSLTAAMPVLSAVAS